jgi:DMSO/TMAO reductase YedYZ molybdopterin-dependent catalytic subunit
MRSLNRPASPPDPAILDNHTPLVRDVERRMMLRGGLSLGMLTMLTGCDPESNKEIHAALLGISSFNDKVQQRLFSRTRLAPTYAPSQVLKPPRFNAHFDIKELQPVDGASWKLELAGRIADKRAWTHQQIAALPQREIIIRHICVEGWDYIGQWSGVPLGDFLRLIGADLSAKYVAFHTADFGGKLYGNIDMATALHPQTLLAVAYAGETLPDPFGFPLRLRTSTKLGFKNPKWITAMEVTNTYPGGYWEDQGFNWFSGI